MGAGRDIENALQGPVVAGPRVGGPRPAEPQPSRSSRPERVIVRQLAHGFGAEFSSDVERNPD